MTKREAERQMRQRDVLRDLGFTRDEAEALRRISMTLQQWYERECGDGNGCIERDDDTGKPVWRNANTGRAYPIPDRETGAVKRLRGIIGARNTRVLEDKPFGGGLPPVTFYLQTDPRGAALYILRPGDVPDGGDPSAYYTRGICIY